MPGQKFQAGDVVSLAGQQWTIASWPHDNIGTFVYYRDETDGTRSWGSSFTGIEHPNYVYDSAGELVHTKGERVDEMVTPLFIRHGVATPSTINVSEDVLAELGKDEEALDDALVELVEYDLPPEDLMTSVAEATGFPVMTRSELRERAGMKQADRVAVKVGDTVEVVMRGVVADVEAASNNWSFSIKYGDGPHNQMKYWINQAHSNVIEVRTVSHAWAVGDVIEASTELSSLPVGALGTSGGTHLLWCQDQTWRGTTDSVTTVLPDRVTLLYVPAAS